MGDLALTVDREQIKRDAERWIDQTLVDSSAWAKVIADFAYCCLALVDEVERTETEANTLIQHWCEVAEERLNRALVAEAKLADVRVLVEALKYCARSGAADSATARKALAAWEDE